jgi:hypothetical protein
MEPSTRRDASAVSEDDDKSESLDWGHASDEPSDVEHQHKNTDTEADCETDNEGECSSAGSGTHGLAVPVPTKSPTGQVVVIGGMLPMHKDVVIKLPWNSIIVGHSFHAAAWLTCDDDRGDFLKRMPARSGHSMRPMVAARLSLCTRIQCLAWQPWSWRVVAGQAPPAAGQSLFMVMVEFAKPMAGISSLKIAVLTVVQEVLQDQIAHVASTMVECGCQLLFLMDPRLLSGPGILSDACAMIIRAADTAGLNLSRIAENALTSKSIVFAVGRHRGVKGRWAAKPGVSSSSAVVERAPHPTDISMPRLIAKPFNDVFTAIWVGPATRSASATRRRNDRRKVRYEKARKGSYKGAVAWYQEGVSMDTAWNGSVKGEVAWSKEVVDNTGRQTSNGGKQGKHGQKGKHKT